MVDNYRWNQKPMVNSIIDILIKNKGEILDKRLEELLKKEFPYINSLMLEDIFLKLESMNIIYLYRISRTKKMVVLNKNNNVIKKKIMKNIG
jgi:hypothetical protein